MICVLALQWATSKQLKGLCCLSWCSLWMLMDGHCHHLLLMDKGRWLGTYIHYITLHYMTLHYITLHYISFHFMSCHFITYIHEYMNDYIGTIMSQMWGSRKRRRSWSRWCLNTHEMTLLFLFWTQSYGHSPRSFPSSPPSWWAFGAWILFFYPLVVSWNRASPSHHPFMVGGLEHDLCFSIGIFIIPLD